MSTERTHADFYIQWSNHERTLVAQMSDFDLTKHIDELALIASEARTRYATADQERRERKAKMTANGRQWLVNPEETNPNISDAIAVVAKRKEKLTKAEKLRNDMLAVGMSAEEVDALVSRIKVTDTSTVGRTLKDKYAFHQNKINTPDDEPIESNNVQPLTPPEQPDTSAQPSAQPSIIERDTPTSAETIIETKQPTFNPFANLFK